MKIVITGASGFIGSRLLQAAREKYGASVTAFSSHPMDGSHIAYQSINEFALSVSDLALVKEADVLIHAGAFIPKSGGDANLVTKCTGNIRFTENILALPWQNLKKSIFLSTIDVYANAKVAISEASSVMPTSLYAMSKLYCERMVELHAAEKGVASQILRIGHVYGPGEEKYAKVIPKAIQAIVANRNVELWGEGEELRSFIYVNDVVSAVLSAVELKASPGIVNVAGGTAISIRQLIEKLILIGGRNIGITRRNYSGVVRDLVFENAKMKQFLLIKETDLSTGLQEEFRHIEKMDCDDAQSSTNRLNDGGCND